MAHINEAPRLGTGAPREACSSGTAEHSLDTKQTPFQQDKTTLADLDAEPRDGQLIDRYGHLHSEGVLSAWSPAMLRIMGVRRVGGAA